MPVTVRNYARGGATGKFVVLESDGGDGDVVLFSDFSQDAQHRDIVRRWEDATGTTVHAAGLRVAGGGWWKREGEVLVLFGSSAAYGQFDPRGPAAHIEPGAVGTEHRIAIRP